MLTATLVIETFSKLQTNAKIFVILQFLDFLSTIICFQLGAAEENPMVIFIQHIGPVWGVVLAKLLVLGVLALVIRIKKLKAVTKANYLYGAVIAININAILEKIT